MDTLGETLATEVTQWTRPQPNLPLFGAEPFDLDLVASEHFESYLTNAMYLLGDRARELFLNMDQ